MRVALRIAVRVYKSFVRALRYGVTREKRQGIQTHGHTVPMAVLIRVVYSLQALSDGLSPIWHSEDSGECRTAYIREVFRVHRSLSPILTHVARWLR